MGYASSEGSAPFPSPANSTFPPTDHANSTHCPSADAWEWLYTMQPVFMLIICILGIVENLFVLAIFTLHKKACTVAEIYLCNLSIADLVLLSCLPFWAISIANGFNWQFGAVMCRLVNMGVLINMYCSIYSLVLVSMDRYVALVHTMSHGRMRRGSYAKLSCLVIWVMGVIMGVPVLKFRTVEYIPEYDVNACFLKYPSLEVELSCDLLLILLGFLIPLSIISFSTCKIIQALRVPAIEKFNAVNTEKKATFLVLSVLFAFVLCWTPFHIVTFLHVLLRLDVVRGCDVESGLEISNQVFTYLAFSNSVLNPILYVIVGNNFRKKTREVMSTASTRSRFSLTLRSLT